MTRNTMVWSMVALAGCAGGGGLDLGEALAALVAPDSLADGHVTREEFDEAQEAAWESLQRLDALEVLEVGALIVDAPMGSHNCYGPCEDDPVAQDWMQEHALQAARLHRLVYEAEVLAEAAPEGAWREVADAVDTLRALEIIEVEDAVTSGNCYVSVCPDDEVRAGVIKGLAKQTRGL